eukprot:1147024-Pelagomonas_calceolata.AAC.3
MKAWQRQFRWAPAVKMGHGILSTGTSAGHQLVHVPCGNRLHAEGAQYGDIAAAVHALMSVSFVHKCHHGDGLHMTGWKLCNVEHVPV